MLIRGETAGKRARDITQIWTNSAYYSVTFSLTSNVREQGQLREDAAFLALA